MRRAVLTIDWRTAAAGWPGGQIYLLDLDRFGSQAGVLDHFVGSLNPQGLLEPGGWTGYRGVFCRGRRAFVADEAAIRVFDLSGDKIRFRRSWTTRRYYDIHDIYPGEVSPSWWMSATDGDECVLVRPHGGSLLLAPLDVWEANFDKVVVPDRNALKKQHDSWHINSVAAGPDGAMWALLHGAGRIVRFRPQPSFVMPYRCIGGHSIRVAPGGEIVVLHTGLEKVAVLSQAGKLLRTIDCRSAIHEERIDPNTGKKASSGWLRGCCILDDRHLVCGTSPAQLFLCDYQAGRVLKRWILDTDVRASTFGIALVEG